MHPQLIFKELGDGPPIFILHGLFGSSDNWVTVGRRLAETFHVYLIDLRNHGLSFHHPAHTYEDLANDVIQLGKFLGLESVYMVGHSMGGKVAMQAAAMDAAFVTKLVVVDIFPVDYPRHHDSIFNGLQAIPLEKIKTRGDADTVLRRYVDDVSLRQFLLKSVIIHESGNRWKFNLDALVHQYDHILAAPKCATPCEVPTHFVMGGVSEFMTTEGERAAKRLFSNMTISVVPNAGHWVHAQFADVVSDLVESHFDR